MLASIASSLVGSLYVDNPSDDISMRELMVDLSKATGMQLNTIESSLSDSFKMSCDLAKTYGLSAKKLMPVIADTGDEGRDKLASQFSFYVSNQLTAKKQVTDTTPETASAGQDEKPVPVSDSRPAELQKPTEESNSGVDQTLQLQFIQDITALITDSAKLNTVLVKVLEGVHVAGGFPRVVLCLLGVDRKSYSGRIAIGTDKELMKEFFTRPLNIKNDIFSRVLMEGVDILVENALDDRWKSVLNPKYHTQIAAKGFVAAPLKSGHKPIGFVYADKGPSKNPITPEQHRAFIQFIAQARLAFQTCR